MNATLYTRGREAEQKPSLLAARPEAGAILVARTRGGYFAAFDMREAAAPHEGFLLDRGAFERHLEGSDRRPAAPQWSVLAGRDPVGEARALAAALHPERTIADLGGPYVGMRVCDAEGANAWLRGARAGDRELLALQDAQAEAWARGDRWSPR